MKKINTLALLFVVAFFFAGCEKDDICDALTSTTPRLVIEFYDQLSRTELKNVTNLLLETDDDTLLPIAFDNVSRITLPLQTTSDVTRYNFILNSTSTNPALIGTDVLEFNYSREDVFVSRACGYKTLFTLNDDDDPETPPAIVLNDGAPPAPNSWIDDIEIVKYNLETENEVHVKIYF